MFYIYQKQKRAGIEFTVNLTADERKKLGIF